MTLPGAILKTSVSDLNSLAGARGFDAQARAKLRERHGEPLEILVVDGGAGYAYFKREVLAGRYPVPPAVEPPPEQGLRQRGASAATAPAAS